MGTIDTVIKNDNTYNKKLLHEYKKAVDAGSIVSKTDKSGRITYVNDKFCQISGYSKEELIGRNHNVVRHPDVDPDIYKDLWDTIKRKEVWHGKVKNLSKYGSAYYVQVTIVPIFDEDENIVEYLALRQDVTDLEQLNISLEERVEEETKKNREKDKKHIESLNSFLEFSPNPIVVYNKDKVTYANSKFLKLIDADDKNIIGNSFVLDSIFEDKKGCTTKLSDLNPMSDTNKISVSMKYGRNIFYLLVNEINSVDDEPLVMYTFNNITLIEYKQLKINHYNETLKGYVKKINKVHYKKPIEEPAVDTIINDKEIQAPQMIDFDDTPKSKRVLDDKETIVLKRSRENIAISSQDYSNDIDEYILEEIQELTEIESEINEYLTHFEDNKEIDTLKEISKKISKLRKYYLITHRV